VKEAVSFVQELRVYRALITNLFFVQPGNFILYNDMPGCKWNDEQREDSYTHNALLTLP